VELEPRHTFPTTQKIAQQVGQGDPVEHGVHVLFSFCKDAQQETVLGGLTAAFLGQALIHWGLWGHGSYDIPDRNRFGRASQGITTTLAAHGACDSRMGEALKDFR
jgi:hypothetical protein